jgi:hypothetical protein
VVQVSSSLDADEVSGTVDMATIVDLPTRIITVCSLYKSCLMIGGAGGRLASVNKGSLKYQFKYVRYRREGLS